MEQDSPDPVEEASRGRSARPRAPVTASSVPTEGKNSALEWVKAIGMPVVTLLVTVIGGYFLTNLTKAREAQESNERLYAQLLSQREQSDALIRKEMFGLVINRFLADAALQDANSKVLQLELLATNFNQSLDLAPLFKDLARDLTPVDGTSDARSAELKKRLDITASNVIMKQVNSLARRGLLEDKVVPFREWELSFGKPFIDLTVPLRNLVPETAGLSGGNGEQVRFLVEIVDVSLERNEVEVRLRVDFSDGDDHDVDRHFWVGKYDFPMLDNTQLAHGLRASVVMSEFFVPDIPTDREANSFAQMSLVVFPAASASFKERQDYDDILLDILRARARSEAMGQERERR